MSSWTPPEAAQTPAADAAPAVGRQRRGTLQSGFSLLSRGEPKIWLTGGMLVICLAMVIGLLVLIVINGMATFWPRPLDWLILNNNQLDIGEPQAIEYRKVESSEDEAARLTGDVMPDGAPAPKEDEKPSRFYRTANFDITGRHYRWFEPTELDRAGIVHPEWALVIERLSWGRMLALPSRLSLPVARAADSEKLTGMLATDALMKELAGQLEELASADTEPVPAAPPSNAAPATESPFDQLTATLTGEIAQTRSQGLKESVSERLEQTDGRVLAQPAEDSSWRMVADQTQLESLGSLAAARVVWDQPSDMLDRIQRVIDELSGKREEIKDLMHEISMLDRRIADARVAVRQAELDTGRSVLAEVDMAGPLVGTLVTLERLQERLEESAARAPEEFSEEPEQAALWQRLAKNYQQQVLAPALELETAALETWRSQFAQQPPAIREAVTAFEATWREVLEQKQPLEDEIRELQAESEGMELAVLVPGEPMTVQLSESDWQQLQSGEWTESAQAALSAQGLTPLTASTHVTQLNREVTQVSFVDLASGRQVLWCVDRAVSSETSTASQAQAAGDAPGTADATSATSAIDTAVAADAADVVDGDGRVCLLTPQRVISCDEIVRIYPANRLNLVGKLGVYGSRWAEYLLEDPREANTEGGVFPAIWGTVVMTLIMTLAVVPFGVIAALYLREYTRSGPIVSLVRISINNLAGVPSIVYGVFGLAFFCYSIGAYIDGGPKNAGIGTLPSGTWYMLLGLTAVVGVIAFLFSLLSGGKQHSPTRTTRILARVAPALWLLSLIGVGVLVFKSPFFDGFYEARLPAPTFGKEGLIWASLTLALLTLPVVIVATEEALMAVPNSLREGSLACGASKWQTIYRIVLPHARPGILTGAILAMARGIGEVAPLMLVGALPVAPDLPLDTEFPYFHGSRSFMHLGYQIYWLGFQSQNSEASKPLVFTCTLLLLLIVVALNLSAIMLRARLRRRFLGNQF